MIARMPEFSLSVMSVRLKPRRLSISSWLRMRSAPPLFPAWTNCPPSSIIAAHWAAMSSSAASAAGMAPAPAPAPPFGVTPWSARARPHSAARSSWSSAMAVLLDDDFLEQHGVHLAGCDREVDAPRQFFAQPVEPGRTFEIALAHLAQIGLERVHDARHQRFDLLDQLLVVHLEYDLGLEVGRAAGTGALQVDQHIGQIEERRRRLDRERRLFLVRLLAGHEEVVGPACATAHDQ